MVDWPSVHSVLTTHTSSCRLWPLEQLLQFPWLGPTQVRQLESHLRRRAQRLNTQTHILTGTHKRKSYTHTGTQLQTQVWKPAQTHAEANHQYKACHQQINKPPTPEYTPMSSPPTYPVPISYLWVWPCGVEASTAGGHTRPLLH